MGGLRGVHAPRVPRPRPAHLQGPHAASGTLSLASTRGATPDGAHQLPPAPLLTKPGCPSSSGETQGPPRRAAGPAGPRRLRLGPSQCPGPTALLTPGTARMGPWATGCGQAQERPRPARQPPTPAEGASLTRGRRRRGDESEAAHPGRLVRDELLAVGTHLALFVLEPRELGSGPGRAVGRGAGAAQAQGEGGPRWPESLSEQRPRGAQPSTRTTQTRATFGGPDLRPGAGSGARPL